MLLELPPLEFLAVPRRTARMGSPSRRASSSRLITIAATASPRQYPSAGERTTLVYARESILTSAQTVVPEAFAATGGRKKAPVAQAFKHIWKQVYRSTANHAHITFMGFQSLAGQV